MNISSKLVLVATLLLSLSACVPVAWVTPPIALDVTMGMRAGSPENDGQLETILPIRAGLYPFQLIEHTIDRPIDVGLGYELHLASAALVHGAFIDVLGLTPLMIWNRRHSALRVGGGFRGHYQSVIGANSHGPAASARLLFEVVDFTNATTTGCEAGVRGGRRLSASTFCGSSYSYGELGLGLVLEGSRAWLTDRNLTTLTLGLIFRIPFSAGAGLEGIF
ncbi:MAG: hypothetical protein H0U74_21055 [Bradymonadaceae bacterium]|nr:hypothetical protein [Lujinxingiaceae bacterium]